MSTIQFYGYWQLFFCAFAFMGLLAIYLHIGRKKGDHGQIWLSLSVLCWSLSGAAEVIYSSSEVHPNAAHLLQGWRSILSLSNSFFILLALPGFRYKPKLIEPVVQSKYWLIIIGLPFLFSLLPTISAMFMKHRTSLISELDVYYAVLTLVFLGATLWTSFAHRRLPMLAWMSLLCILLTFVAQILKLTQFQVNEILLSAIFKSCLIMIFFSLALSWVKELLEDHLPEAEDIYLTLVAMGKTKPTIILKGIGPKLNTEIQLSEAGFNLLQKFVDAKNPTEDGWLEIRPKNETRTGKTYPIRDHNEIKRLLYTLLDGIYGKGTWTASHHFTPLRNVLFEMSEKRERKIRLKVPHENIKIIENQTI